ncbi:Myristoyl-CoA:protein N-myristoyltransferase [Cordyceps fumosorosea ARSEF 2679]|uniref:Glycylpeptide N-tetradecanoyltransferase n=1 Tax=Cordyceps fumosorosea (strain ARSEF 2679) TaxID=1081104 RepID=A0A167V5M0_CORFA|nr:Myristoyl-CoA:protein N-myristoyltransferase [Cordyceps fumosorosea ARSEF 2679]OAA62250.1 Myristoyl-CoA:protein N-myristoyltransferase [Cordyceps fumosorosea ARSEF 2679]
MASDGKKPADAPSGSGSSSDASGQQTTKDMQRILDTLSPQQLSELIALNPALAQEVVQATGSSNPTPDQAAEMLKKMRLEDVMSGLAASGKNVKDMASYKFWATQPVPRFDENQAVPDGPLKIQKVEDISKEPAGLVSGFEWVTIDLTSDEEIKEVYELLNGHYVEDDDSTFRFNYSPSILRWAMMAPGWDKRYHVGVRASQSRKLVAFISAIPVHLRVRDQVITCSEVNFLCVHKKLRGKRLAPVLIKEVTRISNLEGVWQGLYTAGVVLPRPVSTCQYYHRPLNWQKLYEVGFSYLPHGSKPQYQVRKYAVPESTSTKGWRTMRAGDVAAVVDLQRRYAKKRYDIAPELSEAEVAHWLVPKVEPSGEQVVWTYVVEGADGKVTDFVSFYCVESSVIKNARHNVLRVAYLFYYATETGLAEPEDRAALKARLNALVGDALIMAKKEKFDVFNALTLMDNALFLDQQKFARGDGQLHYYLFNYRTKAISSGMDANGQLDEKHLSGVGLVLP